MDLSTAPNAPMKTKRSTPIATDAVLESLRRRGEAFLSLFDDDPPAEVNKLEAKAPNSSAEERDAGSSPASLPEDDSNKISRAQPSSAEVKGDPATYREDSHTKPLNQTGTPQKAQAPHSHATRKAKRLFFAGKSLGAEDESKQDLHPAKSQRLEENAGPSREQFRLMHQEVSTLGAMGLDKRQQKRLADEKLRKLHLQPDKGQRTPANIGKRMVANRVKREQKALEDGIDTGMVQLKGMGKKKQRQKERAHRMQQGLNEDSGAFRNGTLQLKFLKQGGSKSRLSKRKINI